MNSYPSNKLQRYPDGGTLEDLVSGTAILSLLRHCANSKQLAMRPNFVCGFRVRMLDGSVYVRVSIG